MKSALLILSTNIMLMLLIGVRGENGAELVREQIASTLCSMSGEDYESCYAQTLSESQTVDHMATIVINSLDNGYIGPSRFQDSLNDDGLSQTIKESTQQVTDLQKWTMDLPEESFTHD